MKKIKLIALAVFIIPAAIALSNSRHFAISANGDVLQEIAKYKTWQRINKEPIKAASGFQIDRKSGDENVFIIDGVEVTSFRSGELNG